MASCNDDVKEVVAMARIPARVIRDAELVSVMNRPRFKIATHKPLGNIPLLRHLNRLSFDVPVSVSKETGAVRAVGIYARRYLSHEGAPDLWYLEAAKDSGYEGVACVDDTGRAVTLAVAIYRRLEALYQTTHDSRYHSLAAEVREAAVAWAAFLLYMQAPDGRMGNFIFDFQGTKNTVLENSQPGGEAWSARALRGLAGAYAMSGDERYHRAYTRAFLTHFDIRPLSIPLL